MSDVDVAIVGAGVAGLTLAYLLEAQGSKVRVLEATARPGGTIRSVKSHGYLLEYGANSTVTSTALQDLCFQLGIGQSIQTPSRAASKRFLVTERGATAGRSLHLVPAPRTVLDSLCSPLLSPSAKLRCLCEPFIRVGRSDDETVSAFATRRFGEEVASRLVAPILSGIWAADISRLSARCALATAWEAEHSAGSVLLGMLKKRGGSTSKGSLSFREGMETLPRALAAALQPQTLEVNAVVTEHTRENHESLVSYHGSGDADSYRSLRAKHVVLTLPAPHAAPLLRVAAPALSAAVAAIPYAPVGILHLCCDRSAVRHPLDGFGFLIPPMFGTALRGAIFTSSLFPDRAPEGKVLLTCFVGGATSPHSADVTQCEIQHQVIEELSPILGLDGALMVLGAETWTHAIPNYPLGHTALQRAFDELHASDAGISILANWDRGLGVADRIGEALRHVAIVNRGDRLRKVQPVRKVEQPVS